MLRVLQKSLRKVSVSGDKFLHALCVTGFALYDLIETIGKLLYLLH